RDIESCMLLCIFLFSSRRRHTRSKRDWSSDVCSSDLGRCRDDGKGSCLRCGRFSRWKIYDTGTYYDSHSSPISKKAWKRSRSGEIGRASCRERGERTGGGG